MKEIRMNNTNLLENKRLALLSLILLVPAPSIGVAMGMIIAPDMFIGKAVFFVSKIWILLLPIFFHKLIYKQKLSLSKPQYGGFLTSAIIGIAISVFIIAAYLLIGKSMIDSNAVKQMAENVGLASLKVYLAGTLYWVAVNAVLEEYVWRWFVVRQCRALLSSRMAIAASALFFTLHHIAAMQVYFDWLVVIIASVGIFLGGAIWSWCYVRYKSIWPGYLSHAIVDVAVFAIGWDLIFRN